MKRKLKGQEREVMSVQLSMYHDRLHGIRITNKEQDTYYLDPHQLLELLYTMELHRTDTRKHNHYGRVDRVKFGQKVVKLPTIEELREKVKRNAG